MKLKNYGELSDKFDVSDSDETNNYLLAIYTCCC